MTEPNPSPAVPTRQLSLFDATCIIVGIIIGSGIYKTTPYIASLAGNPAWILGAWILGGVIAVLGALCYAELTTTYPCAVGDYFFLSRAFGRETGFLFAWAEYWIVRPGNVGMMAFVFATFASKLLPSTWLSSGVGLTTLAVAPVVLFTILNVLGVTTGKTTQNVLTSTKVVGLIAVIVIGLLIAPAAPVPQIEKPAESSNFRLAMILVLFAYGGWAEVSFVAAEVRHPERNLFRALMLGIGIVAAVYVLLNVAFLRVLGLNGVTHSEAIAADTVAPVLGKGGARLMNLLVCVSALGAINGTLFTGSRIYFAVGTEHRLVRWLGRWSGRLDSPVRALVLQGVTAVALIVGFGGDQLGFERLTNYTAPVYWFFAFLVGLSLFVLRARDSDVLRPHAVPGYPWTPAVFCLICAVMCESGLGYALSNGSGEAWWSIGFVAVGFVITILFDRESVPEKD